MGVGHYENFPVASLLCPPRLRPAVVAIYHFARTADDLADEGVATVAQRLADLEAYRGELRAALAGRPETAGRWPRVFVPLAEQAARQALPHEPLHHLLDAFAQDAPNPRYADREALLAYCARSANPIGRLLLHLYGVHDAAALARSDDICTALQLINFWQDLSVDGPRGRLYVPRSDLEAHGLRADDVLACRDSPAARALVAALCDDAEARMQRGAPLALALPGRIGWELRLVVRGGLAILAKIRALDHATLRRRPALGAADWPAIAWRAWRFPAPPTARVRPA